MTHRMERVRELLKREIGEAIRRDFSIEEAGLISVHDVKISKDLLVATVFVGILGNASQKKRGVELLEERRKLLQHRVGQAVVLKYTPQLKFIVDDSMARGDRVLSILEGLEPKNDPPGGVPPS